MTQAAIHPAEPSPKSRSTGSGLMAGDTPARLRPPTDFCLPAAYRQQTLAHTHDLVHADDSIPYWNADRLAASVKYQFHVYAWGAELVTRHGLRSVLDVGCGPATKLANLIAPVCSDVEGIDQPSGIAAARAARRPGNYREVDLENPAPVRPWRTFDLIICSDVVEHLIDPDPMMAYIKGFAHEGTLILLSTPDRARLRGRACMESTKAEHVREWDHPEFCRFVESRGYRILRRRLLPADDAPLTAGRRQEAEWRLGRAEYSPHRCQTLLCRVER